MKGISLQENSRGSLKIEAHQREEVESSFPTWGGRNPHEVMGSLREITIREKTFLGLAIESCVTIYKSRKH